jgi:hypothetical protein
MSLGFRHVRLAAIVAMLSGASVADALGAPAAVATGVTPMRPSAAGLGRPLPQQQVRVVPAARQSWHGVQPGPHRFYGTIVTIHGSIITLRLRSGRPVTVDATAAIANGNYSAPLFVGKIVSVDGYAAGTALRATHIFRLSNLGNLPADR